MKKSTALERCDKNIRKARQRLRELGVFINAYETETSPGDEMWEELQEARVEYDSTKDYLKRMREWRRNSLSKLQRWAKEKEDRIKVDEQDGVVHGKQNGEQGTGRVKNEEKGVWDKRW